MKKIAAFFRSMTGRIFVILLIGVTLSAGIAWIAASARRVADLRRLDMARAVDRVEDVVNDWRATPPAQRAAFAVPRMRGIEPPDPGVKTDGKETLLEQLLMARLPEGLSSSAKRLAKESCTFDRNFGGGGGGGRPEGARFDGGAPGGQDRGGGGGGGRDGFERDGFQRQCWLVTVNDAGHTLSLVVEAQPRPRFQPIVFDPAFLGALIPAAAALALLVARLAAQPLLSLSQAATALGDDLTRQPLPLTGPSELRDAATAFNAMQVRLQRQLAERTHMLAAITHDLQTPVTRLRLRLEKVDDPELRERLLGDLSAMQTLIREGLDLARSAEHSETPMRVDLQSLVDSLVDDAADAGQDVTGGERCDVDVTLQPAAMSRCLSNLIGNALKYGGSAEVSVAMRDGAPEIRVRDHGPGLPEDQLAGVFEPFVRLEDSRSRETGGVGLGLTIARTLAERNGATITLANHPDGGAEAVIRFRKAG